MVGCTLSDSGRNYWIMRELHSKSNKIYRATQKERNVRTWSALTKKSKKPVTEKKEDLRVLKC